MDKRNEYIIKLLQNLQSLESKVSAIKREDSLSFSFFREAFQKSQEITNLLHEMEMLQIEDMKHQMEKLVLFLSENENQKNISKVKSDEFQSVTKTSTHVSENESVEVEHDIDKEEIPSQFEDEEKKSKRNIFAEGIELPTYTNPRIKEIKNNSSENGNSSTNFEHPTYRPAIVSVNDALQVHPSKLEVKRGLSLNDRFYYQRELFDNNREMMNSMMSALSSLENYEVTVQYLKEHTSWNFEEEAVKSFLDFLKRGFE